jgi:hypothetical protein
MPDSLLAAPISELAVQREGIPSDVLFASAYYSFFVTNY